MPKSKKYLHIEHAEKLYEQTLIKDLILAVGDLNSPYHIVIKINPAKINNKVL